MFQIDDNQQGFLIDPFDYLGSKRKELLESGWSKLFRNDLIKMYLYGFYGSNKRISAICR